MLSACAVRVAVRFAGLAAALAGTSGCGLIFAAPKPMPKIEQFAREDRGSRCLVVFLPGFGDDARGFLNHGFADAFRARGIDVDVISTGATFGYYMRRTLLARLREDVLVPARARGYEQIWVVGVSMGGLGTLLLAKDQDAAGTPLAGIYLLAPYLGRESLLREIDGAGGLARWQPGKGAPDDYQRDVWRYLKRIIGPPASAPAVYLGAGDRDNLGYGHRVLAAALPNGHVFSTPGGHDWGPWSILWSDFLDDSDFRERCAP
jgi:pimeloyl-ACP methyl ester carboxylesterase